MEELDLAVGGEDLARFLETLVGELGEGDVTGAGYGSAATPGSNWELALGGEEVLFAAGVYCGGIEGRWRGRRWFLGGGFEGRFRGEESGGGEGPIGEGELGALVS